MKHGEDGDNKSTKMESIPISIPISIAMKIIQIQMGIAIAIDETR